DWLCGVLAPDGQLVFTAEAPRKPLLSHAPAPPGPPSRRNELPIPPGLGALVLSCLAKDRELRPASSRDLLQRLETLVLQQTWTDARARAWWKAHLPSSLESRPSIAS